MNISGRDLKFINFKVLAVFLDRVLIRHSFIGQLLERTNFGVMLRLMLGEDLVIERFEFGDGGIVCETER